MLKLDSTAKSLEVVLAGAVATTQLPIVAAYVEVDQTTFEVLVMAEADTATNNTTAVAVVAAPGAGKTRKIDFLSIVNVDTAPVTVTVRVNNGGTFRIVQKVTLAVGDNLVYVG
jgi:hypothetical protein